MKGYRSHFLIPGFFALLLLPAKAFAQAAETAPETKEAVAEAVRISWMTVSIRVVVLLVLGWVFLRLLKFGLEKLERKITRQDVLRENGVTLRLKTLIVVLRWLGTVLISGTVLYAVLETFGINVAPVLAGAGIVGLAFGFGGQYLIRDIINGIFILVEDQYGVNDVVRIGDQSGLVESVNLRLTILRDFEGRVIYIPNGEVKTVINFTKDFAYAVLKIGVAYKEDIEKVMDVIREIGKELRKDPKFSRMILADMEMSGVDDLAESQVTILFRIKTLPMMQWDVARELRLRVKKKFDELGIEIPFPQRTMYFKSSKEDEWIKTLLEQQQQNQPEQGKD